MFPEAHTFTAWQERQAADELLEGFYELARLGPTTLLNARPRAGTAPAKSRTVDASLVNV